MLLLLSIVKKNSKVSGSYGMEGENNDPICPERSTPSKRNKAIYKVHKKQKKSNGNKNIQFQQCNTLVSKGVKPINRTYIVHKLYTFRHDEPIENQP